MGLKKSAAIHLQIQNAILSEIRVGTTPKSLDKIAQNVLKKHDAKSPFYGFHSYPNHICVSVNHEILHGIPTEKSFQNGDVVKIDIGVEYENYVVDGAFTVIISTKNDVAAHYKKKDFQLVKKTYLALQNAINRLDITNRINDFAYIFNKTIKGTSFYLIENYMGHGVGRALHEEPQIPNSLENLMVANWKLRNGMALAIEPMIFDQKVELEIASNGWTVRSINKKAKAAHFEETVFITNNKIVSLTHNDYFSERNLIVY